MEDLLDKKIIAREEIYRTANILQKYNYIFILEGLTVKIYKNEINTQLIGSNYITQSLIWQLDDVVLPNGKDIIIDKLNYLINEESYIKQTIL